MKTILIGLYRLNYQHGLLKQHLGFLLHPSIAQTIGKARVADIGTGTG
jgi:16S rRNA G527 N7-methylase RsmG